MLCDVDTVVNLGVEFLLFQCQGTPKVALPIGQDVKELYLGLRKLFGGEFERRKRLIRNRRTLSNKVKDSLSEIILDLYLRPILEHNFEF